MRAHNASVAPLTAISPTPSPSTAPSSAAKVLSSPRAAEMGIYAVRAFVKLRELLAWDRELARGLDELGARMEMNLATHVATIGAMLLAIRQLVNSPTQKRPGIGFTADRSAKR